VLALAIFLLGFVGFAVDMTNLWFHRQMAQGAADAACQAGVMNLLIPTPTQGFDPQYDIPNCGGQPAATPCAYARLNGYDSVHGNQVSVAFAPRVTVPGVTPPPTSDAPYPFIRVDVADDVPLTFSSLITGGRTQLVRASAWCGLVYSEQPIPIIILNPTCAHSFDVSGSATVAVVGGPPQSIQVNSWSTYPPGPANCAAATINSANGCNGSGTIDLRNGGPGFAGSEFGTSGGPGDPPSNFLSPSPSTKWLSRSPIRDPYKLVPAPAEPTTTWSTFAHTDPYGTHGCPDRTRNKVAGVGQCHHYLPGKYTQPISVKGWTAIFDPGLYYIAPTNYTNGNDGRAGCAGVATACTDIPSVGGQCYRDFLVTAQGVVRMSTEPGDGSGGAMFYLSSAAGGGQIGSVVIDASAGSYSAGQVDDYLPTGDLTSASVVSCPGFDPSTLDPTYVLNINQRLKGNVLMGPCTQKGSYPLNLPGWAPAASTTWTDAPGPAHGFLFFQDRANADRNGQPAMQGGGGMLLAGTLYFHNCTRLSPDCFDYNTDYNASLDLRGNPGSDTRVLGNIIADQLIIGGNGEVKMALDPNLVIPQVKATLLR
jgi:hypothetical protein